MPPLFADKPFVRVSPHRRSPSSRLTPVTRRQVLLLSLAAPAFPADITAPEAPPVRIAVSEAALHGVNRNDAAAAISVWAQEMARTVDLKLAAHQSWLQPSSEILANVRSGTLDVVLLTIPEYRRVKDYLDSSKVVAGGGAELWLMVRDGAGITKLADLQGRHLAIQDSTFSVLADAWLAVSFARAGLGPPPKVLGRISRSTRAAATVLPVFFGQADACIAPRRTVETMFELNPQLATKLKPLLTSPNMISAFLVCRKDYPAQWRAPMFEKFHRIKDSSAAKQVLTLFQAFRFSMVDGEALRPSLALLEAAERLPDYAGPKG